MALVTARVPRILADDVTTLARAVGWEQAPPLALVETTRGGVPRDRTTVRVATSGRALHLLFDCEDRDVWGTHGRRDAPLWEEEAVEVFIAPGRDDPRRYVEIEVSPAGFVFDAIVYNPDGRRDTMTVDSGWTAAGLVTRVGHPRPGLWQAELSIPWSSLTFEAPPPEAWRANFFRIERHRGEPPEFSAWSPTGAVPADFHKPASFGLLVTA
jgi:hypothetical protein